MIDPVYERSGIRVYHGDCRELVPSLGEQFAAVVTDPPYGLSFMGRDWDHAVPGVAFWEAFRDAMLPGAHLLAFGGSRTYHRIAVAIEDAGFEIRDTLMWMQGSGFPKSHNVGKALDAKGSRCHCGGSASVVPYTYGKPTPEHNLRSLRSGDVPSSLDAGTERREVLQPGVQEPSAPEHRTTQAATASTGSEQPGVEGRGDVLPQEGQLQADQVRQVPARPADNGAKRRVRDGAPGADGSEDGLSADTGGSGAPHRPRPAEQRSRQPRTVARQPESQDGGAWPTCGRCGLPMVPEGLGTALKPAYEPIILARKPLSGTVAANVLEHGAGALNIDACRIGTEPAYVNRPRGPKSPLINQLDGQGTTSTGGAGRWPSNVILDETAAAQLDQMSGERPSRPGKNKSGAMTPGFSGGWGAGNNNSHYPDSDHLGASRFFPVLPIDDPDTLRFTYQAKASRRERNAGLDGLPERDSMKWSGGSEKMQGLAGKYPDGSSRPPQHQQNSHPTVKPLALMRWLLTLVTPPGGTVLDPFAGSGTTGVAAAQLGIPCVLIEQEAEYLPIIAGRIDHALDEYERGVRHGNGTDPRRAGARASGGDSGNIGNVYGGRGERRERATGARWPSNVLMDRAAADVLDQMSGERRNGGQNTTSKGAPGMFGVGAADGVGATRFAGDTGGASRFMTVLDDGEPEPDGVPAPHQLDFMTGDD